MRYLIIFILLFNVSNNLYSYELDLNEYKRLKFSGFSDKTIVKGTSLNDEIELEKDKEFPKLNDNSFNGFLIPQKNVNDYKFHVKYVDSDPKSYSFTLLSKIKNYLIYDIDFAKVDDTKKLRSSFGLYFNIYFETFGFLLGSKAGYFNKENEVSNFFVINKNFSNLGINLGYETFKQTKLQKFAKVNVNYKFKKITIYSNLSKEEEADKADATFGFKLSFEKNSLLDVAVEKFNSDDRVYAASVKFTY